MVVCSQNGIEPSEECYKICVISHRCGALKYWKKHNTNAMDADPLDKMMPYLWRLNNWIDNKAIHIRAWFTAALDGGEWDTDMDNDIIAKMWKEKHG
jgi:hypothetical protein